MKKVKSCQIVVKQTGQVNFPLSAKDKETNLFEGSCCEQHQASSPQRHHEDRGECHHPSQSVCPVRVHVPVVELQVFVVSKVENERDLGVCGDNSHAL